ncbi:hypothetical protein DTO006G1_9952 [Penicillium roqueforti]|nr:hypothetical protein CBS147337_10385 [Penicillium roqueforti]KAI2749517.1 hypothetical protein DTO006G1_9952 [Penicillium roqueforti]KAI3248382.1 hypothetical protein DTO006G7_9961 [Penicillium roqueforti]
MSNSDSGGGFWNPSCDHWPEEPPQTPPHVWWPKPVLETSVESDGLSKDSGGIESEIPESRPSVQPSEPVLETSVESDRLSKDSGGIESEIPESRPSVQPSEPVREISVVSISSCRSSDVIESEILESRPSVQLSEPVREISVVSISSSQSSDVIEVPASGAVATSITRYTTVDGRSISLLECLRHYFPSALLNADLRSSSLGTDEMCLHCVLRVAFDDPATLHDQKPFCNPGPGNSCRSCSDQGLACFRIPPLGSRELTSDMLRRTQISNSAFSQEHWRLVCRTIAETVGVSERELRQAMLWDNRYLRPCERSARRPE